MHLFLDQTEKNSGGNESIIWIDSESGKEDALEKIHSSSVMDDESCEAESMENTFSSYCNQKKVPRQLLMGQSVEVVRSLPHDIKYITLKLTVGFNSYKLLRTDQSGNEIPTKIGLVPILLNANTV